METQPRIAKTILRKKNKLEVSHALTLNYTTNLQYSKLYGAGTRTDTYLNSFQSKEQNQSDAPHQGPEGIQRTWHLSQDLYPLLLLKMERKKKK